MAKGSLLARLAERATKDPAVKQLARAVQEIEKRVSKLEAATKPTKPKG